jgi:drug/metabolite transporter (DMT)-like permease
MLLVCAIWGANFTVTKLAFAHLAPLAFTAVRFVAGSAVLALLVRLLEPPAARLSGRLMWRLLWLGILGNTFYQVGFVLGLARSSATSTSLILAAAPAAVAVFAAIFMRERVSARAACGIALGIGGVTLVVFSRPGAELRISPGDLFTVGAMLSWSLYTVGLNTVAGLSSLRVTAWTIYLGTPGIILAAIPELGRTDWRAVGWSGWTALSYSVLLSLILAYVIWNRNVREVGGTRTAIYLCVTPLLAVLVAWAAMGERPGLMHVIGGGAIVAGVVLTRLPGRAQQDLPPID